MKTQIFGVLLFSLFISNLTFAQDKTDSEVYNEFQHTNFIYLYTKKIHQGNTVVYKKPFFKAHSISVDDDLKFKPREVKFFQNEEGFFANTRDLIRAYGFAERIQEGKINLYEQLVENNNPSTMNSNGVMTGGGSYRRKVYFYNSSFGDLKKVDYDNLQLDLQSSPAAMSHLKRYKKAGQNALISYVIGGAITAAGFLSFRNKAINAPLGPGNEPNFALEGALIFGGVAVISIGYLITNTNKKRHLTNAISAYNK